MQHTSRKRIIKKVPSVSTQYRFGCTPYTLPTLNWLNFWREDKPLKIIFILKKGFSLALFRLVYTICFKAFVYNVYARRCPFFEECANEDGMLLKWFPRNYSKIFSPYIFARRSHFTTAFLYVRIIEGENIRPVSHLFIENEYINL